jgi:deoxyribodipyrimidine photolyase-related protein
LDALAGGRRQFGRHYMKEPSGKLVLVLGDQLDCHSAALNGCDADRDVVLLIEAAQESEHVASHVQRTVLFLSAMRHFAVRLEKRGYRVLYVRLDDKEHCGTIAGELSKAIAVAKPREVRVVEPGEHRVRRMIENVCREVDVPVVWCEDRHFYSTPSDFAQWAKGRKSLTMEYWYRQQRQTHGILVEPDGEPVGGTWNLDAENRQSFGKGGPDPKPTPLPKPKSGAGKDAAAGWAWDEITRDVVRTVQERLRLPGEIQEGRLQWPVTHEQAQEALRHFVDKHLPHFGPYEDAMWSGEPFLYHSLLSSSHNLKLLNPRDCVEAALQALKRGAAPLQSVEAFIRQIIGWREFIRGVYFLQGQKYETLNALGHEGNLPEFYWHGRTDMKCLSECIGSVVKHGFAHHIPRLMVMGNFSLLAGVHPKRVSDWYLGMFVDGVDWVTLPNALGMSQYGDGGIVGSKPYICGGAYIKKMSNFCSGCKFDPGKRTGESACPFTTLYWDFLMRHRPTLARNQRVNKVLGNIDRFSEQERVEIRITAQRIRQKYGVE